MWLDGDILTCACPECGAPMSVRLWLLMADCWRCKTSVELTPEQQRQAQQLIDSRRATAAAASAGTAPVVAPAPPPATVPPPAAPRPKSNLPVAKLAPPIRLPSKVKLPRSVSVTPPPLVAERKSSLGRLIAAAAILLLLAIAAFALWHFLHRPGDVTANTITDKLVAAPVASKAAAKPASAIAPTIATAIAPPSSAEQRARRAADELSLSRDVSGAGLADLPKVVAALRSPDQPRMFEGRDPRIRTELVEEEGGSIYTEAAVVAGLHWLSQHQANDGHWGLNNFNHAGDCNGQCDGQGDESDTAGTALALLPFLGAGQSSKQGIYQDAVARGVRWLVQAEKPDGDLRGHGIGNMYAHGLATIALCEALAMSHDETLRAPAQAAVDFIVRAQHKAGGWRYEPGQDGDLSVVGWQLMALQSAKMAYLKVPDTAFQRAGQYLDTLKSGKHGGFYAYQPGQSPTSAMMAEGLLCRQYLGWPKDHPGMREGINRLMHDDLPNKDRPNIYYWYYGTQVMHHIGGEHWKKWNVAVRDALLAMQEKEGHRAGSFAPRGGAIGDHDTHVGGRIYMTSLALCTLEVYYRYLPLYRAIDIGE
jgi:hypothetical protein